MILNFSNRSDMSRYNINSEIQKTTNESSILITNDDFRNRIMTSIAIYYWFHESIFLILSFSNRYDMSLHNIKYEIQNFGERLFNINHEWWFQKSIHEINSDLLLISWIDFWFSFSNRSDMNRHNLKYEIQNFGERIFNFNHGRRFQNKKLLNLLLTSWLDFWIVWRNLKIIDFKNNIHISTDFILRRFIVRRSSCI